VTNITAFHDGKSFEEVLEADKRDERNQNHINI
jgi:hypothetical protein